MEGMAQSVFTNPKSEARAWYSQFPFLASPNMLKIPQGSAGLDNGSVQTWSYLAQIWYQTQLVLNNSEYQQVQNSPIDWGYEYAMLANEFSNNDSAPQAGLFNIWMTKALQIENNGIGPQGPGPSWWLGSGWNWMVADISREVSPGSRSIWAGTPASTRSAIYNGLVQSWLQEVQQFTPQQFAASGISLTTVPTPGQPDSGNWIDRVFYMIPQFAYYGVSQTLINQMAAWAQSMWPNGNWSATTTATCSLDQGSVASGGVPFARCSTE